MKPTRRLAKGTSPVKSGEVSASMIREVNGRKVVRLHFNDVFIELPDSSLVPKKTVEVNGTVVGRGTPFIKGVKFSGVDLFKYKGHDLAIKKATNDSFKIVGYF